MQYIVVSFLSSDACCVEAQLHEANEKAKELQRNQKDCAAKLARAEKLIDGLGGEQASWSAKSKKLGLDYNNLTGRGTIRTYI